MLEMIIGFLNYTGLKEDTFGRLTVNDPRLIEKLRNGRELSTEAEIVVLRFMHNYEDAKD